MAQKAVYPKGVRVFAPHQSAPDFVKGSVVITLNELVKFCKENPDLLTEYNGEKQIKLNLLNGEKGLYAVVDTYKKEGTKKKEEEPAGDLPF